MAHAVLAALFLVACAQGPENAAVINAGDSRQPADSGEDESAEPEECVSVVVVGGGPAGLAFASEQPSVVFEARGVVGGDLLKSGSLGFFVGIPEQAASGFSDSIELAVKDWPALTGSEATEDTLAFLEANLGVYERLQDLGLPLMCAWSDPWLSRERYYGVGGGGEAVISALLDDLDPGSEIRLSTPVDSIVVEQHRARGIMVGGSFIEARHVVVATGGYGSRADLLGPLVDNPDGAWSACGTDSGGNGIAVDWARAGGWDLRSLESVGWFWDFLPVADQQGRLVGARGDDWIWVDQAGARFIDETSTWSMSVSSALRARAPVWGIITRTALEDLIPKNDETMFQETLARGELLHCADDLSSLAARVGVDAAGLGATLDEIATLRAAGLGDAFGRTSSEMPDLQGELCAFLPGQMAGKTFGGVAVDASGRVLDAKGQVIEGLWAIGEAAGMSSPGMAGRSGLDGAMTAVLWSGWRSGAAVRAELDGGE